MGRIAITGHRDLSRRTAKSVGRGIRRFLRTHRSLTGLTCLADGSDQLFARIVLERGGSIEAFIAARRFADTLRPENRATYESLYRQSTRVRTVPSEDPGPESYMYASRLM